MHELAERERLIVEKEEVANSAFAKATNLEERVAELQQREESVSP